MSGKVLPVSTSDNFDDETSTHREQSTLGNIAHDFLLQQFQFLQNFFTWENFRNLILWLLDTASFKVSISVRSISPPSPPILLPSHSLSPLSLSLNSSMI
jgi:hypothetical protein